MFLDELDLPDGGEKKMAAGPAPEQTLEPASQPEPEPALEQAPEEEASKKKSRELFIKVDPRRTTRIVIDFTRKKRVSETYSLAEDRVSKRPRDEDAVEAPPIPMMARSHVLADHLSTLTGFTGHVSHANDVEHVADSISEDDRRETRPSFFRWIIHAAQQFARDAKL